MSSPKIYNEQNSNKNFRRPGQVLMSISWWECGSMSASLWSGLPLSLGFCIRDVLQKWTWWMWKSSINPEWLWQWIPFQSQLTASTMVMCFEFQQTEGLSVHGWTNHETKASLKSPRMFLTGVAQPGAGPAISGDWTGVFRLSTERVLCLRLQCRPAHSTLPACLHPDLQGPAKGEKAIRSPCPSHACLVGQDWPCMLWMVPRLSGLMGKLSSHGGKPMSTGSVSTQHSPPQSMKFQHLERQNTMCLSMMSHCLE